MHVQQQLDLLANLRFDKELSRIPSDRPSPRSPYYDNASFAPADAAIYHSLIRHFRPRRIIEIGAGESTRFAAHALALNISEGDAAELVAIEPFEAPFLDELGARVVRDRVEDVGLELFSGLGADDFIFIDSSHVARPGGDVAFLLLEVVPALPPGVVIHIHDVFTPRDYPEEWSRRRWFWSEQYVVEALLTHNPKLEVLLSVSFMLERYPVEFGDACPVPAARHDGPTPSSLWLRTA
jgi:predicted O-methyltransferase YrrM